MTDHLVQRLTAAVKHIAGNEWAALEIATIAIREARDLDCLNERAFDLLRSEGQYEATQPERYRFKEKTE
jgi:hypothetical protein